MRLAMILARYAPGSQSRTWDDEERDILARRCLCCGQAGHYQHQLEAYVADRGLNGMGVCLGDDGRVWDGNHRVVAARRLGIENIPVESWDDAQRRWKRDHGPVAWHERTHGDAQPEEYDWMNCGRADCEAA